MMLASFFYLFFFSFFFSLTLCDGVTDYKLYDVVISNYLPLLEQINVLTLVPLFTTFDFTVEPVFSDHLTERHSLLLRQVVSSYNTSVLYEL